MKPRKRRATPLSALAPMTKRKPVAQRKRNAKRASMLRSLRRNVVRLARPSLLLGLVYAGILLWGAHETRIRLAADASSANAGRILLGSDGESAQRFTLQRLAEQLPMKRRAPEDIRRAIESAAETVGVDRRYLTSVAALESGFDARAHAPNSTASGLYQFTEQTWLRAVKAFGPRHDLERYAARITIDASGAASAPRALRNKILHLRQDPEIASLMAAELALDNGKRLEALLGRPVSPAETYIGHFLGVAQGARVIRIAQADPQKAGERIVPAAADANPGIFRPKGQPASAGAILNQIEAYFRADAPSPA